MKILLGVKGAQSAKPAISLLGRLRFKESELTLIHTLERLAEPLFSILALEALAPELPSGGDVATAHSQVEGFLIARRESARQLLKSVAGEIQKDAVRVRGIEIGEGDAAECILQSAEKLQAELIAVGYEPRRGLEAFFSGSAARKLAAHARQSVLVAKGAPATSGRIDVILANDHSEYTTGCLKKFLSFAPQGLRRVVVLTAYNPKVISEVLWSGGLPQVGLIQKIEDSFQEKSEAFIEENLRPLGVQAEIQVVATDTNEAIRRAVYDSGAELVVLGARSRSRVERVFLGSVAFEQVARAPHSVLVMRA